MSAYSAACVPFEAGKRFVMVLHDVAPETRETCELLLADLANTGAPRASLVTAPRAHRQLRSQEDPAFRTWLAELARRGHDICLNGFEHIAVSDTGCRRDDVYCMTETDAVRKLREGMGFFRRTQIDVAVFHAPCWSLSEEARRAALESGIRCNIAPEHIELFEHGHRLRVPAFEPCAAGRISAGLGLMGMMLWQIRIRNEPIVRVSTRVADVEDPQHRARVLDLVRDLAHTRHAATCRELLDLFGTSPR